MLSFADDAVLDEFQLHKPADWRADPSGQATFLSTFNDTYAETWLENPGRLLTASKLCFWFCICLLDISRLAAVGLAFELSSMQ